MHSVLVLVGYGAVGVASAVWIRAARRSSHVPVLVFVVLLWPFLLPTYLWSPDAEQVAARGRRARLDELRRSIETRRTGATAIAGGREWRAVHSFIDSLESAALRIDELETNLPHVPQGARSALIALRERQEAAFDRGVAIVEELDAQLVVLHFAGGAPVCDNVDGLTLETVLARIEALVRENAASI